MPVTFTIMNDLGLVYVRYRGVVRLEETLSAVASYAADPGFRFDQKHLVDLSEIDDYERNFVELMKAQAHKAASFSAGLDKTMMVYYAPTKVGLMMAQIVLKSWDGLDAVVARVTQDEEQALHMLGLSYRRIVDLPITA